MPFTGGKFVTDAVSTRHRRASSFCFDCETDYQTGRLEKGSETYNRCVEECGDPDNSSDEYSSKMQSTVICLFIFNPFALLFVQGHQNFYVEFR